MTERGKRFYWRCCDVVHYVESTEEALIRLTEHEAKEHKKKLVGSFGFEFVNKQ